MAPPTLHIIDGSGYIFRAFYAIRPLSTRDGTPTNAVIGFARMLGKLLRETQPQMLGIAFDPKGKTFRHERFAAYKENREATPEELVPQFGLIRELVTAMDIPILEVPGYEADDVLATIAFRARERGHEVVVVSADKDLTQLVGDGITVYDPMKDRLFDSAAVEDKYGVPPARIADLLALAGDPSDNIPGVPKVGQKSAAKLIQAFGDVEQIIAGLEQQQREAKKLKAFEISVLEHTAAARLSKELTTLNREAPIDFDPGALALSRPEPKKLSAFLRRIEAHTLLRDFGISPDEIGDEQPASALETEPPIFDRSLYRPLTAIDELDALLDAAAKNARLCVDLQLSEPDPRHAEIVGIGLATAGRPAAYVPLTHRYLGAPKQLRRDQVLGRLAPLLADPAIAKTGHDLKLVYRALANAGLFLAGIGDDSLIAAYVLDPTRASFTVDSLAREAFAHETIRARDVMGAGTKITPFDSVTVETAASYAAERADVIHHLCGVLPGEIQSAGLVTLYRELELPLLTVLAEMETTGIRVDTVVLGELAIEFKQRLDEIEARAHLEAGETFNLASPKQLATLFFEKLGYPVQRKNKTGYSTDHDVLETLAVDYELPRIILQHRQLAKLKSTYIDALNRIADPADGRVHTTFNQAGTATGRLSSADPNLQNIPIRTEEGRRIRSAFVAQEGWELISADYSQIELRVMAHLSGDKTFTAAFNRGEDIHRRTAMEIFSAGDEPDTETRRRAKAINFGILYGLSPFGLSRNLGISTKEAQEQIERYFKQYPGIRAYLDQTIEGAGRQGYVTTLFGRRRFIPDIKSRNRNQRQAAERTAMNTPIQGTAADLIKKAMLGVSQALKARRLQARLLLQVHDELVLEAPGPERDEVVDIVRQEMSRVATLRVPLVVDVGWGRTWASAH